MLLRELRNPQRFQELVDDSSDDEGTDSYSEDERGLICKQLAGPYP